MLALGFLIITLVGVVGLANSANDIHKAMYSMLCTAVGFGGLVLIAWQS